jgi:hypothetical protein
LVQRLFRGRDVMAAVRRDGVPGSADTNRRRGRSFVPKSGLPWVPMPPARDCPRLPRAPRCRFRLARTRAWSQVPSVTSKFPSYFVVKITSCETGYARSRGARVGLLSVLRFIPIGVFDDATVRDIGRAFDLACKQLNDSGQPDVVHEVMIKRIIAAARRGERDVKRLRDAGLTGLRTSNRR